MNKYIKVKYTVYSNLWHIKQALEKLASRPILSFDTETRGLYTSEEREQAKENLKDKNISVSERALSLQVSENSGLSFPSLIRVTHFIFGLSEDESVIFVCNEMSMEKFIWNWVASYEGKLLIQNTLYDLKIMYNRIGKFPKDYEDTALLAKCLINNSDTWKAKVGLKDLMGSYYDPKWTLMKDYEPDDLKDENFILYCSIDGAATMKLWNDLRAYIETQEDDI